ncbi:hypothetical protein GGR53DRAFT_372013 [Hypoxylon sp. FL1150]|nr:hypothetical protein GGR53DRAFT_372013 [Hypoxylon sp. FL1150]
MDLFTKTRRSQYSILSDKDSVSPSRDWSLLTTPSRLPKSALVTLLVLLTSTISGIVGYHAGQLFASGKGEELIPLNRAPVTFEYEFNYAEAPSDLTNQRWESLFPLNGGFFEHPSVGPEPVAFSVFHQLHCLDGIRNAYWNALNSSHSEEGAQHPAAHSHPVDHSHSHSDEHSSDTHVRHCLEYLRQSIMCAADTTIEPTERVPEGNAAVRGFGTVHICKDFRQLVEWTSQWESKSKTA